MPPPPLKRNKLLLAKAPLLLEGCFLMPVLAEVTAYLG